MDNGLINLLPPERQGALAREYHLRLATIAAMLVTALACVAGMFLVPTYLFLVQNAQAKGERLANIEAILSSSDEKELSAHLDALSNDATLLLALARTHTSATLRTMLAVPRTNIMLSGFTYAAPTAKAPETLTISGTAATRDALRSYQVSLQAAPFAAAVNVPVSAYAKDADIPFVITITLAP